MKFRKNLISILAGLLAAVMIFGILAMVMPITANGQSSASIKAEIDALEDKKAEVDAKIKELEQKASANMGEMEKLVAEKNRIDQETFLIQEQIKTTNDQIIAYSALIADKQEELDQAQARLALLQEQNKERIRAMEKNGGLSYWSVIFKANNFIDLLDRLKMVQEIAEADKARMSALTEAAAAVTQAKKDLEGEKTSLESVKTELEESQVKLEEKRAEADVILAELAAKGEEYQNLVESAEHDRQELKVQILDKEEKYDAAKEKEYQEWLAQNPPAGIGGSSNNVDGITWLMPINYTYFSSPFGYRWHPIHGDWRMHYGVDLSAPTGTPIYASRSGVVNVASYEAGGAGYYVNIDHKDGFMTRYMHMTHFIVYPGQYVYAGQVIGYCGSTGGSTGPHLHFGVYYNGVAVNPAYYINI